MQLGPDGPVTPEKKPTSVIVWLGLIVFGLLGWFTCSSYRDSAKQTDVAFCQKNLSYYESFCKTYPANCKEGPRQLARCN